MKKILDCFNKVYSFLISVKFAVLIILALGVVSAVGTVYESMYDAELAQALVYHSKWMYTILGLMCFTLIGVIVDRYPWRRHHLSFILAHIGIIFLVLGAYITSQIGVDGSLAIDLGKKARRLMLVGKEVNVYGSFGDSQLKRILTTPVNFLQNPPSVKKPLVVEAGHYKFEILDYQHFTDRESKIKKSKKKSDGPALRFQIEGSRAQFTEWLRLPRSKALDKINLGPAKVVLTQRHAGHAYKYKGGNVIVFYYDDKKPNFLTYEIYTKKRAALLKKGKAKVGDLISTGWMDFKIRILNFYSKSKVDVTYKIRKNPGKFSQPAIQFRYKKKDYWMGLNASRSFFEENMAVALAFEQASVLMDFDVLLEKFEVGRYPGTMRAASYASDVVIEDKKFNISMNEPLKYKGFTFYQSSFQEDDMGRPTTSILSVNKDPGRWLKYLGSFLIVLGAILLFYFKKSFIKRK